MSAPTEPATTTAHQEAVPSAASHDSAEEKTINEVPGSTTEKAAVIDESRYIEGRKLVVIFSAFLLSVFLVSLDQTIVGTALPHIVSQFNALDQVTWVASAYFLTQAGFMLTFGQFLAVANTKWVYMGAITVFELGSLICGVAPNMNVLILGRAVAGTGGAGIFTSILSIIAQVTRLEQRPALFGTFGGVFAVSSVIGPLLGGALTDHASWRWCFYINLPIGALSILVILFVLKPIPPIARPEFPYTGWRKWVYLDWIGTTLCLGMVTSLVLPLQWGGVTKAWTDPTVYAMFPVFGVLLATFLIWEYKRGPRGILPLVMFKRRAQIGCALASFFVFMGLLVAIYYLPLWYQATRGHSATRSGIDILPFMLSVVIFAGLSGGVISKTGRYWPWLFGSPLLFCLGSGLLFTVGEHTSTAKLIGFQIIFGCGIGGALQNTAIAIQTEYAMEEERIPQATSIVQFLQLVGGIIGIAIAGTVFDNQLKSNIPSDLPAGIAKQVSQSVEVIKTLQPAIKAEVIAAYVKSLQPVFIIGVPAGILGSCAAILIPNYNIHKRSPTGAKHAAMA